MVGVEYGPNCPNGAHDGLFHLLLVHDVCLNSPMLREGTSLSMTYEIFNEELRLKITFGITKWT